MFSLQPLRHTPALPAYDVPIDTQPVTKAGSILELTFIVKPQQPVGGNAIAGIGVSGASGGNFDEECARTAIAKIEDRMK